MLRGMLSAMGFEKDSLDSVCITFDKLDKIGAEGVKAELTEKGCPASAVEALDAFLNSGDFSLERVAALQEDKSLADGLLRIMETVKRLSDGAYGIAYTPSLVRGQGYYTGVVFEITCAAFSGAVAGGGRYDGMIGKFTGQQVPAVGFSIGFERICGILLEQGFTVPAARKLALLYRPEDDFAEVLKKAQRLRGEYAVTVLPQQKKLGKQLGSLESAGFAAAAFFDNEDIKPLGQKDA